MSELDRHFFYKGVQMSELLNNLVSIDFEYNKSKNYNMDIVSVAARVGKTVDSFWLYHDDKAKKEFLDLCRFWLDRKMIMLCHNAMAEGRAFMSLGFDPLQFNWIDNFVEHRMLTNCNDRLMFGKQLIDGKEVRTHRKKWDENSSTKTQKPQHSYAATVYKMLGVKVDTDHKDKIRDIIIYGSDEEILENKDIILKYNESDTDYLLPVYVEHLKEAKRLLGKNYIGSEYRKQQHERAMNMLRTAIIERDGYPIDYEKVKNFSLRCGDVLDSVAADINRQFPDIKPFKYNFSENRFSVDTKVIKKWVQNYLNAHKSETWEMTKTGLSLKREMFERFRNGDEFIEGDFGNQMFRYYYTKQHLNGFTATKGKATFWDCVGSDKRVRPWLNPYGSQSSRYQPAATGYIPLKAKWMRSLIMPDSDSCIVSIDYKSQEYFLGALIFKDYAMLKAYFSGDVYLAFAKDAKLIPQDATKETHKTERNKIGKPCVLGIGFGLTKYGLSQTLNTTKEQAQKYIDLYAKSYPDYWEGRLQFAGGFKEYSNGVKTEIRGEYQKNGWVKLPDNWYLFGDNDNNRSVANFPVQGLGACILRKVVQLAQDRGLTVILPLHDAAYIQCKKPDVVQSANTLADCMIEAVHHFFIGHPMEEESKRIGLDIGIWGFEDEPIIDLGKYGKVQAEYIHVEEGSEKQYEYFKQFFEPDNKADLL